MDDLISRQEVINVLNDGAELLRRVLDETYVVGDDRAKYEWGIDLIESYISEMDELPSEQPERKNEPAGCNGCRYDWFGDPRCAKCSRSFQDHYEAERKEE